GLTKAPAKIDQDEPQFAVNLSDLMMPEITGTLVPADRVSLDLLIEWRAEYLVETLGEAPDEARRGATEAVDQYLAADSHRVLLVGDEPVAFTGLNARLPSIVQVGGVYTPPRLRKKGYARQAVALHLKEIAKSGVREATLFAASEDAARTYIAIGFRRIGSFSIILFQDPLPVAGSSERAKT
ncbi:MAG: GNAT family N-acetyltransferase, partial [Pseudomonadota bacterium]